MPSMTKLLGIYSDFSYSIFGFVTQGMEWERMKKNLSQIDDLTTVPKYFSSIIFTAILFFVIGMLLSFFLLSSGLVTNPEIAFLPFILPMSGIAVLLVRPLFSLSMKKRSIKALLPLAILTMSAAVESGAPPQYMFRSVAGSKDYPKLGEEFAKLERYMNTLHMSLSEAIIVLMDQTPSVTLRRFLAELNSTVRTGGDLKEFMRKRADKAYFEYSISIEEANKRAETFGDIYTAVLIAAPLFLFSSIMLMGIFGSTGGLFGMSIDFLLTMGIFIVIPAVNVMFILMMEFMTPEEG
ncbi:MAG: type II secretion system F family protein [archaeon]